MFDIKIKIGDKELEKSRPKLNDYRLLLEYNERNKGKTFLSDPQPVEEAMDLICSWFGGISKTELEESLDLQEIFETYRKIESNVTEVFTGVPLQKALKTLQKLQG